MTTPYPARPILRVTVVFAAFATLLYTSPPALGQENEVDREFEFASGLIDMGFPDYASTLMDRIEVQHPDLKDRIALVRAQIQIASRNYEEAEEIMNSLGKDNPKAQAISLALANAYYRTGETEKAKNRYQSFFEQYKDDLPQDRDLLQFYQESAYTYGRMMENIGEFKTAIDAYEIALNSGLPEEEKRRLYIETAELCLKIAREASGEEEKTYLDKAWDLCEDVQWGNYDLWFGRSISIMAHIQVLRGDREGARELILDYMSDLRTIDELLKENNVPRSISPMAGARYLLGELYLEQAEPYVDQQDKEKAGPILVKALQQFENVFRKYPNSDWGPEAGVKSDEIKDMLSDLGIKIRIDAGELAGSGTPAAVFKAADNLYRQKKYAEAAEEYISVLNRYPESDASVDGLGNLAMCYVNMDDHLLEVKIIADYLAERFSDSDRAALQLLRLGKTYLDKKQPDIYYPLYETYLEAFKQHDMYPQVLYTLAILRGKGGETGLKKKYLQRLVDEFPESQYYVKALRILAYDYYRAEQFDMAIPVLKKYAEAEQPGFDKAQAQFVVAESLKKKGDFSEALKEYTQLVKWLAPRDDNPYRSDPKQVDKVTDLLEKALFFRGYCYFKMEGDEDASADYRRRAIRAFRQFIGLFEDSDLAPEAYRSMGTAQLALGNTEEASETFNTLAEKYPDSEAGKNAFFLMVDSLIEIGQEEKARDAFSRMVENAETYSPAQWVRIGQLMLDRSFYAEARQAMEAALEGDSQERSVLERSMFGLGKAQYELGNYKEAAEQLNTLMETYPKSALFYDAKFLLAGAYRETGEHQKAIDSLSDVFKYAKDATMQHRASVELAEIQRKRGQASEALASYLRVSLLADSSNADVRPVLQEALLKGIDLAVELEKYQDALDLCEQFLNTFPESDQVEQIRDRRADIRLQAASAG